MAMNFKYSWERGKKKSGDWTCKIKCKKLKVHITQINILVNYRKKIGFEDEEEIGRWERWGEGTQAIKRD
jgi:DUF971 family protein